MNYAETKLLIKYAKLQLEIVTARNPTAAAMVSAAMVHRTTGYKLLRAFYTERLTERTRPRFREFMSSQIDGVRKVMALAEATGERISIGEVEFSSFDAETGASVDTIEARCPGSGGKTPSSEIDGNDREYIKCLRCLQRWSPHDIGLKLPAHLAVMP